MACCRITPEFCCERIITTRQRAQRASAIRQSARQQQRSLCGAEALVPREIQERFGLSVAFLRLRWRHPGRNTRPGGDGLPDLLWRAGDLEFHREGTAPVCFFFHGHDGRLPGCGISDNGSLQKCCHGTVAWLRLCVEKVVHHWDDDGHALHQCHVSGVGQDGQSRCGARLHVAVDLATL